MGFSKTKSNLAISLCVAVAIVVLDQLIKYAVKTNCCLHDSYEVTSWMYIYFVENSGMAFGMSFIGTAFLTIVRMALVAVMAYYLCRIVVRCYPVGYIICISLVLAGALGNIIDNAFYGLIYSLSTEYDVAELVPFGQGYGSFMSGRVVDMFYFPIIQTFLPDWIPFFGGRHFVFFSPVFNFADASITCGSIIIILFYRKYLTSIKTFALNEADIVRKE